MSPHPRVPFDVRLPSRYQVSRLIGRGGAAVVLQARDLRLQREVAVKVFTQAASTPEVLIDQEREAQLLARSGHPNLVTIFDVASDRGATNGEQHLFLVMEYVDGPDLAQWLRTTRATTAQVVELGAALCAALQFVHRNGVLHCDIKPSNVLLQRGHDGELIPKLADFGIAAVLQGQVPQGEFTVGTAAYLSPEQVEGHPLQEPSDVYALGLVLLEAATGRVAFPGAIVESAFARLDQEPEIGSALPAELAEILRGMTQRDPADRRTLAAARAGFRRLQRGEDPGRATGDTGLQVVVTAAPEESPTLPALRTIGSDARMPALDRAVALAARAVGAAGAYLLIVEGESQVLQAVHGVSEGAATALSNRYAVTGRAWTGGSSGAPVAATPVTDTRGERLGTLVVVRERLLEPERELLADVAFLAGQVLELRSATRRALLSR